MNKTMCLTTRGSGFIGFHLANELIRRGDIVTVAHDTSVGNVPNSDNGDTSCGYS